MRLSRSATVSKRRRNQRLGNSRVRKKHKRLDAICEKVYNRNHRGVKVESSDCNVGGNESELRRSTRVRRAPVVLDASPPPAKKRRKIDKMSGVDSVESVRRKDRVKSESPCSVSRDLEEELGDWGSWRSRLRSRAKNGVQEMGYSSPRGKRKLFEDLDGFKDQSKVVVGELDDKTEVLEGRKSTVVKSKRPGRVKASNVSRNKHREIGSSGVKEDGRDKNEVEMLEDVHEDCSLSKSGVGNEGEVKDNNAATYLVDEKSSEIPTSIQSEECIANDNVKSIEQNKQAEQPSSENEGEKQRDATEIVRVPGDQVEDRGCHDKLLEDEVSKKVDTMNCTSTNALRKPRIKEGRRCGLCGGGTDGKPPKKLVQNGAGSDNEAYSGSSGSEEPNYDMWDGFGDEPGWLGCLLGPINDRFGIAGIWVHQHCAVWSPEVYFAGLGCLKNVRAALCRGKVLKCSRCVRRGATIGCRVDRCPKTYHLPCARANGCIFDHRKFLIACTDHRHLFQPYGSRYFYQLKKMKVKKMKLEMRKLSNDALRKDVEAEEKWLENCGEDEEFLKRESKRLHRDLLRIAPVYIGGSKSESEMHFQGWESVAGLQDVTQCLKEVVILPLLYPEFFNNMGLTPPRGVLLHGYPGTGKTLVVRALIGSCARGDKRIAYFARKGADCLGKYVGDAERQLRLLFQVAEKSQPSIIFFDEIDGLAPCRTRQQDQTHNSVVSTLLALLDGLKSRGSVVVIGATNRPDAVDPALRRPGRFDREIYFPLPSVKDREAILSLHTQKWPKPVTGSLLKWIASRTAGFAGADLQALCTQAAVIALKRSCPLQKILSAAGERAPQGKRPSLPTFSVEERDWLEALSCAPPPCSRREAGMAANDVVSSPLPGHLIHCLLQPLSRLLVSFCLDERVWLPLPLSKAAASIKTVIVSALEKKKVRSDHWWSHFHDLLQEADIASEIVSNLSRASNLVGDACFFGFEALDDDSGDDSLKFEPSKVIHRGTGTSLLQNLSYASGKKSGFRILISGNPRTGQKHLASCILHCFVGNVEIRKVDLATISQEGHGDVVQGITQILTRCASVGSCLIFMPRIDLWAVETSQVDEEESDSPSTTTESSEKNNSCSTHAEELDEGKKSCPRIRGTAQMAEPQDAVLRASHLWSSFIEQFESISVSTSLMILATSEMPFPLLPLRIRQFFKSDTLDSSLSSPLEDTVPRFSIQVDVSIKRDMVIDSCAEKLSKDLAQHFVQLIHHRSHNHASSCKEDKVCDTVEGDADILRHNLDPGSTTEHGCNKLCPVSPVPRVSLPPNKRNMKGKSSLLLAICSFGYQILRYPHFSELCWFTSNLKEGPCADISGPWKGWPFNSCIIRPNDSLEKVAVACSSSNIKSKEVYGSVRGLIAVGLSAYRGVYTSLREVSSEVRKVLELLAGQISGKIQAGKDRYQFIRLLSQVAYLEDMVNSWQYTLLSLEAGTQLTCANPKLNCMGSVDKCNTCEDNLAQSNECKSGVPDKSLGELEVPDEVSQKFDAKNIGCVNVKENGGFVPQNSDGAVAIVEESSPQLVFHHTGPAIHSQSSAAAADPLHSRLWNEQNFEPCRLESTGNHTDVVGDFESLKHSNGFACTDSAVLPMDSSNFGGVKFSSSGKECNQDNGTSSAGIDIPSKDSYPNSSGNNVNINPSSNGSDGLPTDSGVVCMYHCCSGCLLNLDHLIQKILLYHWGLKGSDWTVEDVHDIVTSLSINLHSAVRKLFLAESSVNSFDKNDNYRKLFEGQEMGICQCKNSGNGLPLECHCHSRSKNVTAKENSLQNPRHGLDLELIYRGGVRAAVDPDKDVSFHCKFESLCLCSLIEWILMTKKPSD